jgi:hypothetical protein
MGHSGLLPRYIPTWCPNGLWLVILPRASGVATGPHWESSLCHLPLSNTRSSHPRNLVGNSCTQHTIQLEPASFWSCVTWRMPMATLSHTLCKADEICRPLSSVLYIVNAATLRGSKAALLRAPAA